MERRVTSRYRGGKISRSQQPFLGRDGHLHFRTMEKIWATFLFLSKIMHRKVKQVNFFRFLISLSAGSWLVEVQKFLLPWQLDVTTSPLHVRTRPMARAFIGQYSWTRPCEVLIGPLQLAIHVVQDRHAGEEKSHWDKTKKRHT